MSNNRQRGSGHSTPGSQPDSRPGSNANTRPGRGATGPVRPPDRKRDSQSAASAPSARRVAFDVIRAVHDSDAYANLLLPVRISRAGLSSADAGLATELAYGTLRMMGYYDRVIELAAKRPVEDIDAEILDVLRLGVHQLLSMRVAPHAAVNESVGLARAVGSRSAVGFANGVLRTITRSTPAQWRERVMEATANDDDTLSAEYSHPAWIIRAFRQSLAAQNRSDELVDLLAADNVAPLVNLVALPGTTGSGEVVDAINVSVHPAHYSPVGFYSDGGDPFQLPGVRNGSIRVQDEGSQLAALVLSRAREVAPGEVWLDMCAGPGGKAALLASEAAGAGARLIANEIVPVRAGLVRRALEPVAGDVEVWELDGTTIGTTHPETFDRILVDAPCTGLGALRRRPEARWRKSPRDVAQLVPLQTALLDAGIRALAPGGILAYVTCSPHIGETRTVVATALKQHDGVIASLPTARILQQLSREHLDLGHDDTTVQLWPHRHGTDAMFIALFTKPGR